MYKCPFLTLFFKNCNMLIFNRLPILEKKFHFTVVYTETFGYQYFMRLPLIRFICKTISGLYA